MNAFYAPADWLAYSLDARTRRALNFWLLIAWLIPGTLTWILLRDALWFVGFMSLYAIWTSHAMLVAAETPVENEGSSSTGGGRVGVKTRSTAS